MTQMTVSFVMTVNMVIAMNNVKTTAVWTNDCCGKKDFDGEMLTVSSRYWPKGGSGMAFDTEHPGRGLHRYDDGSQCSASSKILFHYTKENGDTDYLVVAETGDYITGATQEEVQTKIEDWVQKTTDRILRALIREFGLPGSDASSYAQIEVHDFDDGDQLVLYQSTGSFAGLGHLKYLCLSYGERDPLLDTTQPAYMAIGSEYFHPSEMEKARHAFNVRKNAKSPSKSSLLGYSLDEVKRIEEERQNG